MKRPLVHQAKWLVLGLLKTTASALATSTPTATATSAISAWSKSVTPFTTTMLSSSSSHLMLYSSYSTATASPIGLYSPPPSTTTSSTSHLAPPTGLVATTTTTTTTPSDTASHSTTSIMTSARLSSSYLQPQQQQSQQIVLRLAQHSDVSGIATCNLQTLPENYNDQFYHNHLSDWPDLAIVAVLEPRPSISAGVDSVAYHPPPLAHEQQQQLLQQQQQLLQQQQPLHSNYEPIVAQQQEEQHHGSQNGLVRHFQQRFPFFSPPAPPIQTDSSSSPRVVAYLLGKVCQQQPQYIQETIKQHPQPYPFGISSSASKSSSSGNAFTLLSSEQQRPTLVGHVSSLAVLSEFRRRGLAEAMLEQFHIHLQEFHQNSRGHPHTQVGSTGLHVRRSNTAAVHLYKKWGYTPAVSIPHYYEDGEDAFYMLKRLQRSKSYFPAQRQVQSSSSKDIPRVIGIVSNEDEDDDDDDDASQLLSGAM